MMRLIFLGTGTSTGVPMLNCDCKVCTSSDPRDRRRRCSAIVETPGGNILIDCGPDFVSQILDNFNFRPIDAVLFTHSHYDHVGGTDDLRPYCTEEGLPLYCTEDVEADLRARIPYCFREHPYPGVPKFVFKTLVPFRRVEVCGEEVVPLDIIHSPLIPDILGFRIGKNLAYITDAVKVPEETMEAIAGIDTLVINALRIKPHGSHQSLGQALEVIRKVNPGRSYLIHLSHDMGLHSEVSAILPAGVTIAYDGLSIEIP